MRNALLLLLAGSLLAGCASPPSDPGGTWINQAAIDAAARGESLRESLLAFGPNLEWRIDPQQRSATFSNGFELGEGRLVDEQERQWRVEFPGDFQERLSLDHGELVQQASQSWPEQRFTHPAVAAAADAPTGASFEHALYAAYLGGTWTIREGLGEGGLVLFHPDGSLEGLPGADRYALCLAGDCASMAGDHDSLWLQLGDQGHSWLFERAGKQLKIIEALNDAAPDEIPEYRPGAQAWLLERD